MERIDRLKAEDADLADWLRALQAEHEDLQAAHPTGRMSGRIWNKLKRIEKPKGPRGIRIAAAVLAPAFALVLILMIVPIRFSGALETVPSRTETEVTRLKGSMPELYLYRKSAGGAEALRPGGATHAGDLIQVHYEAAGRKYGAIFSRDGNGLVTRHLPETGNQAALLAASGKTALASAFELDETPGREVFHFIASDRPFTLDSILASLSGGAESSGPDAGPRAESIGGMSHTVFVLTKESLK